MSATRKEHRYYSLDFWRGAACLMVVIFHSTFYVTENPAIGPLEGWGGKIFRILNHFDLGVPMFFVISGYCITAACEGARHKAQPMKRFFIRRFRRIFPPFWVAFLFLLVCVFAAIWCGKPELYLDKVHPVHSPDTFSVWRWLGNVTLTESWRQHLVGDGSWYWLGPSWSLSYEEQFYAACGLMLVLSRTGFFRSACIVTSLVLALGAIRLSHALSVDGFFFDGHWLMFAAGIAVYYRLHVAVRRGFLVTIGLLLAAVIALAVRIKLHEPLIEIYYISFLFAALLAEVYRWDVPIATSLLLRPITYCGIMCYSLYLIHWPIVKPLTHILYEAGVRGPWPTLAIVLPASLAASIAAGWAFHNLIERRFLNTAPILPWHLAKPETALPPDISPQKAPNPAPPLLES